MSVLIDKFSFHPSAQVGVVLLFGGAVSVGGVLIIPIPAIIRIILAVALVVAFLFALYRHARRRGKHAIQGLRFHPNGDITVFFANNQTRTDGRITACFISPYLSTAVIAFGKIIRADVDSTPTFSTAVITYIKTAWGNIKSPPISLLVMPDSLPADEYRQFRLHLNTMTGTPLPTLSTHIYPTIDAPLIPEDPKK